MKARPPFKATPPLSMEVQDGNIQISWPTFVRFGSWYWSIWQGWMQPTPESGRYRVEIEYALWDTPKARVLYPKLVDKPPHVYPSSGTLCLYHEDDWYWHGRRLLATSFFPWTANWLFFYELWLDTGVWHAPEVPHGEADKKEAA